MDQSYHGGAAAGGSADFSGQMWVRGTRVLCVRHSASLGACLVLRLLLIRVSRGLGGGLGCEVLVRTDAPLSDDTRPRAGLPAGWDRRLLAARVADLTLAKF
jgi:hypothetical protein